MKALEKLLKDCRNMDITGELNTFGDAETVRLAVEEYDNLLKYLETFFHAAEEMRRFQALYFKNRLQGDLQRAKAWEREVDKMIKRYKEKSAPPEAVQEALL